MTLAYDPIECIRVGNVYLTAPIRVAGIRLCESASVHRRIAKSLGGRMPSEATVRAAHAQAPRKVAPLTRLWWQDGSMAQPGRIAEQSRALDVLTKGESDCLVSSLGKDWLDDPEGGPGVNFGWFGLNGKPLQPVSRWHDEHHLDYSQHIRVESDTPIGTVIELPAPAPEPAIKFVQAKNFYRGRLRPISLVVIHTMEAKETTKTAENVASWFAGPNAPQASAHYNVDCDSIVQSVREEDTAWHAGRGANSQSCGIEHAGYALQGATGWADAYSQAMLERSACLVADICKRHGISARRLSVEELARGESGIVGHSDCVKAFKNGSHGDPGPTFPWEWYLSRVRVYRDAV
jgi:hypothetical protein